MYTRIQHSADRRLPPFWCSDTGGEVNELINGQSNLRLSPRPIKTRINEDSLLNQKFALRDNRRLRLIGVYL